MSVWMVRIKDTNICFKVLSRTGWSLVENSSIESWSSLVSFRPKSFPLTSETDWDDSCTLYFSLHWAEGGRRCPGWWVLLMLFRAMVQWVVLWDPLWVRQAVMWGVRKLRRATSAILESVPVRLGEKICHFPHLGSFFPPAGHVAHVCPTLRG